MIPRYARDKMVSIWSPETKFRIWFEIEAHATDALAELGVVPKEAAKKVWEKGKDAKFDVARIDEIEREVKHDVIAFLTHLSEIVGPEARFVHQGDGWDDNHDVVRVLRRDEGVDDEALPEASRGAHRDIFAVQIQGFGQSASAAVMSCSPQHEPNAGTPAPQTARARSSCSRTVGCSGR